MKINRQTEIFLYHLETTGQLPGAPEVDRSDLNDHRICNTDDNVLLLANYLEDVARDLRQFILYNPFKYLEDTN